jgi:hypothetical protein
LNLFFRSLKNKTYFAATLISGILSVTSHAADLTRVDFVERDHNLRINLATGGPTKTFVSLSDDGLVITIDLPDIKNPPSAPIMGQGIIAAALVDRLAPDHGLRLRLFARTPLRLGASINDDPAIVSVQFEQRPITKARTSLEPVPKLDRPQFPTPTLIGPIRLHIATGDMPQAVAADLSNSEPPKPVPPVLTKPNPAPVPAQVPLPPSSPAPPPAPIPAPAPNAAPGPAPNAEPPIVAAPVPLSPRSIMRPKPPEGISDNDPVVKQAMQGDNRAAIQLGTLCLAASPPDAVNARAWFAIAAKAGDPLANFNLGEMFRRGVGGPLNEATAVQHYAIAAEGNVAQARYRLALMLLEGKGTEQDVPRARALLEAAALQGHTASRRLLDDLAKGLDGKTPQ